MSYYSNISFARTSINRIGFLLQSTLIDTLLLESGDVLLVESGNFLSLESGETETGLLLNSDGTKLIIS